MRTRNFKSTKRVGRTRMTTTSMKPIRWTPGGGVLLDGQERQVFAYFHNMKGFDSVFIQETLYKQSRSIEKPLTQGAKMMSFKSGNLVFHDSLNFFNMALEKFPATFNLQEMHKGFIPHQFNRVENYSYRSVYPPAKEYEPDQMPEKKRKAFLTWHAEKIRRGAIFDF